MSNNRFILPLDPISASTSHTKARLINTLNEIVKEVNTIHELYEKFFGSVGDRPVLAEQIEEELASIKKKYLELFDAEGDLSKVEELDQQIKKIKDFHRELFEDGDELSISTDIKDSQQRITDFYLKLFSTYEKDGDGGQEAKLKAAFQSIISFDDTLNKADVGYRAKIEKAKVDILAAYKSLIEKDKKTGKSRVDILDERITQANEFHEKVENEISPFLDKKQKYIEEVSEDIEAKRRDVDSLLSETTVKALAQGYKEAMQIYGEPVYGVAEKGFWGWSRHKAVCAGRGLKHFAKFVGSYVLFIGPLVLIGWLFVSNGWQGIFNVAQNGDIKFSGTEYIFYKLTIALPLLWVSWYGQKNISHRKRLFEEYNHKLRVVQMYMHFVANNGTYTLEPGSRKRLEDTLLDTIERNPSEVYGKDETLLDKIVELLQGRLGSKSSSGSSAGSSTDLAK